VPEAASLRYEVLAELRAFRDQKGDGFLALESLQVWRNADANERAEILGALETLMADELINALVNERNDRLALRIDPGALEDVDIELSPK
jgi:hypothetical protein